MINQNQKEESNLMPVNEGAKKALDFIGELLIAEDTGDWPKLIDMLDSHEEIKILFCDSPAMQKALAMIRERVNQPI